MRGEHAVARMRRKSKDIYGEPSLYVRYSTSVSLLVSSMPYGTNYGIYMFTVLYTERGSTPQIGISAQKGLVHMT